MNARQSLLFLCCVLAGLALLCFCLPSGLPIIGGIRLRLPSLAEVMGGEAVPEEIPVEQEDTLSDLTPEELLQMRQDALNARQMDKFRDFCTGDAARIYMPCEDETYLDGLWETLQGAATRHVRIMHYGDSQIECDRITSLLRQKFQEKFGGMGVGLVPARQTIPTFTLKSDITPEDAPQYLAYGPADMRTADSFYGPLAKFTHIPGQATISLRGMGGKDYGKASRFSRVTVITRQPASILLKTDGEGETQEMPLCDGEVPCFYTMLMDKAVGNITLEVQGETDILGIQLDGQTGVNMDNIPMRGSSGRDLTTISRSSLRPFFRRENVALLILQFGGNSTPYLTHKKLHDFKENMKRLIRSFQELAPEAKILLVGPADMAHNNEKGELESYPILPALNDSLRAAADETGTAFWNMYAAMGGKGSIIRWVEATPQLAGEDYIHFTSLGAKKIAQLLYDTLQLYHRFYRFRTGQENAELTADDSAAVDIKQEELQK